MKLIESLTMNSRTVQVDQRGIKLQYSSLVKNAFSTVLSVCDNSSGSCDDSGCDVCQSGCEGGIGGCDGS